ncbi:MAG TPA: cytochrome c-type biogenesis CcmF C-terminal domain-containing protein, partial [Thermoleophilaceae bacterium]|nr:cytochrome c-type biogenesis CcmF C-terminal domain-containing protein [Thermoleophilaceae bacterium]
FAIVAFTLAVVGQELWRGTRARRVMTGEAWPAALSSLIGRNRRRYGGYTVHAGIALLFLGVAASSAFVEQRDERLSPGETIAVDDYEITYREPTAEIFGDSGGTGAAITFGAVLEVTDGDESFTLNPLRNYYPVGPTAASGPLARFFEGQPTSEVDLRWGLGEDVWVAVQPDVDRIAARFAEADERFQTASTAAQVEALRQVPMIYRSDPPPAQFRVLVSPLVSWIWVGGAVVVLGALISLWPAPDARRRRVTSLYAARLGRELSRA